MFITRYFFRMPARNKTPSKSKSPRKTKEKVVEEKDASNDDHMDDDEELADGVDPLDDDLDGDYVANEEEESESDDQESQVIIVMYVTLSIMQNTDFVARCIYIQNVPAHTEQMGRCGQCTVCHMPPPPSLILRVVAPPRTSTVQHSAPVPGDVTTATHVPRQHTMQWSA